MCSLATEPLIIGMKSIFGPDTAKLQTFTNLSVLCDPPPLLANNSNQQNGYVILKPGTYSALL